MTSPFDETEFVDRDLQSAGRATTAGAGPWSPGTTAGPAAGGVRPPSREELESKVGETQGRIAELKRAQEELERQRVALEDARRRRAEFETGRTEMLQHLTRGVGLLEKAEFDARRDAEQMAKSLEAFREALTRLQGLNEQAWTAENWNAELTRALTTIENARMEWNAARLKWNVLDGTAATGGSAPTAAAPGTLPAGWPQQLGLVELCRVGLALTWPLALVAAAGLVTLAFLLARR